MNILGNWKGYEEENSIKVSQITRNAKEKAWRIKEGRNEIEKRKLKEFRKGKKDLKIKEKIIYWSICFIYNILT